MQTATECEAEGILRAPPGLGPCARGRPTVAWTCRWLELLLKARHVTLLMKSPKIHGGLLHHVSDMTFALAERSSGTRDVVRDSRMKPARLWIVAEVFSKDCRITTLFKVNAVVDPHLEKKNSSAYWLKCKATFHMLWKISPCAKRIYGC